MIPLYVCGWTGDLSHHCPVVLSLLINKTNTYKGIRWWHFFSFVETVSCTTYWYSCDWIDTTSCYTYSTYCMPANHRRKITPLMVLLKFCTFIYFLPLWTFCLFAFHIIIKIFYIFWACVEGPICYWTFNNLLYTTNDIFESQSGWKLWFGATTKNKEPKAEPLDFQVSLINWNETQASELLMLVQCVCI